MSVDAEETHMIGEREKSCTVGSPTAGKGGGTAVSERLVWSNMGERYNQERVKEEEHRFRGIKVLVVGDR